MTRDEILNELADYISITRTMTPKEAAEYLLEERVWPPLLTSEVGKWPEEYYYDLNNPPSDEILERRMKELGVLLPLLDEVR